MLRDQAVATLAHRQFYGDLASAIKTFCLRLSITHSGMRWKSRRVTLKLRGIPQTIEVRSSSSDFHVVRDIFEGGEYASVKQWSLPADARIMDLGANIGCSTLYFSTLFPRLSALCVEPDKANFEMLKQNLQFLIQQNQLRSVRAFAAADAGVAAIDNSAGNWGIHKTDVVNESDEAIDCRTLPSLLADWGDGPIDLIKCDIEGAEAELFARCAPWIQLVRHLIVEVHRPYTLPSLYRDLSNNGWSFEVTHEHEGYIVFLRGKASDAVPRGVA